MSKLFKYFLCLVIVVCGFAPINNNLCTLVCPLVNGEVECCYYVPVQTQTPKNCKEIINGNSKMLICSSYISKNINKSLIDIKGQSVKFFGIIEDYDTLVKKLITKVVQQENIDGIVTVYGYNAQLNKCVYINNQSVNIQIAFKNGTITVGSPVILGSY